MFWGKSDADEKNLKNLHENTSESVESMDLVLGFGGRTLPQGPSLDWQRHLPRVEKLIGAKISWCFPFNGYFENCANAFNDIVINFFPHLPLLLYFSSGSLVDFSHRGMKAPDLNHFIYTKGVQPLNSLDSLTSCFQDKKKKLFFLLFRFGETKITAKRRKIIITSHYYGLFSWLHEIRLSGCF